MSTLTNGVAWTELRAQWQTNTRLRVGAWAIIGILWIYGLLLAGDAVVKLRQTSGALAAEIERLEPMTRNNPWPARVEEARQQLAALRTMEWAGGEGGDLGLTEAALQDWVRATAAQAGLRVREMTLTRAVGAAAGVASPGPAAAGTGSGNGSGPNGQALKLRLSVEWGRGELAAFLAEVGRSERVVVVERLLLRPAATPPSAEMDLRVWSRGADTRSGAAAGPAR